MRLWPAFGRARLGALTTRITRTMRLRAVRPALARRELARRVALVRSAAPRRWLPIAGVAGVVAVAVTGVTVVAVTAGSGAPASAAGVSRSSTAGGTGSAPRAAVRGAGRPLASAPKASQAPAKSKPASTGPRRAKAAAPAPGSRKRAPRKRAARPLRTSCRSIAHIGDSTSADLISPDYLPNPAQRLAAQYADVGVRHALIDASGGRSIVEALPGQVNGYDVARNWDSARFRGCWVIALGTNDTANVAVGSAVGLTARIDRMMAAAHGEPVMWVNTRTELAGGYWSEANERTWDNDLEHALARFPNMRIFDWSSVAQPGWFLSDGIHYTSAGCAARASAIAHALARAFPAGGHSASRIVR